MIILSCRDSHKFNASPGDWTSVVNEILTNSTPFPETDHPQLKISRQFNASPKDWSYPVIEILTNSTPLPETDHTKLTSFSPILRPSNPTELHAAKKRRRFFGRIWMCRNCFLYMVLLILWENLAGEITYLHAGYATIAADYSHATVV